MIKAFTLKNFSVIFFACLVKQIYSLEASIQVNPYTVNSDSTLGISLKISLTIQVGGLIRITPPSDQIFFKNDLPLQCSFTDPPGISISICRRVSTQLNSGIEIVLGTQIDATQSQARSLFIQVSTCKNPLSTAGTSSFTIEAISNTGMLLESVTQGLFLNNLVPGLINTLQIWSSSSVIGKQNIYLTITFLTKNPIPPSSSLILQSPIWNPQAPSPLGYFDGSKILCLGFKCTLKSQTQIQIQGLSSSQISSSTNITIQINGFRNPIIPSVIDGFKLYTQDQSNGKIDESNTASMKVTEPNIIENLKLSIDSGSKVVQDLSVIRFDFNSPIPLNSGCILSFILPSDYSLMTQTLESIETFGIFGFQNDLQYFFNVGNEIEIRGACSQYVGNTMQTTLRFKSIRNPSTVRNTGSFQFKIKDLNNILLIQVPQSIPFFMPSTELQPGLMRSIAISTNNATVQEFSTLTLEIKPSLIHSSSAIMSIFVPLLFSLTQSCSITPMSTVILNKNINCQVVNGNEIRINLMFYSFGYEPDKDGAIKFSINNVIINPSSSLSSIGTFRIASYESRNNILELLNEGIIDNPYSIRVGSLQNVNITINSNLNDFQPAQINIGFQINHKIPKNGRIRILLPPEITYNNSQSVEQSCKSLAGFQNQNIQCSMNKSLITISSGFPNSDIQAGSLLGFSVGNFRLPRYSGVLENVIVIQTADNQNQPVDAISQQIEIINVISMKSCQVQLASLVNRESTQMVFSLQISDSFQLLSDDYLSIFIPKEFIVNNKSFSVSSDPSLPLLSEYDGNFTLIMLSAYLTDWPQVLNFTLNGIKNPSSTKPVSSMKVQFFNQKGCPVQRFQQDIILQTNTGSQLQSVSMTQSSTNPDSYANYYFQIIYKESNVKAITLVFPSCIQVPGKMIVQNSSNNQSLSWNSLSQNSVLILTNSAVNFRILSLINPNEKCMQNSMNNSFKIYTYEDEFQQALLEMKEQSIEPSLSCLGQCSSCTFSNKTYCLSCNDNRVSFQGNCLLSCPDPFFQSVNQCIKCSDNCKSCQSLDQCIVCDAGYILDEGICVKTCPDNKFLLGKQCQYCSQQCGSCKLKSDHCTSCKNGMFFVGETGQCLTECPDGYNQKGKNCQKAFILYYFKQSFFKFKLYTSYFPLICLEVILFSVALGSFLRNRHSSISSIMVTFTSIIGTLSNFLLAIVAYQNSKQNEGQAASQQIPYAYFIFLHTGIGILIIFCQNGLFIKFLYKYLEKADPNSRDCQISQEDYVEWRKKNPKTRISMFILIILSSFHSIRFYDSFFYGLQSLKMDMYRRYLPLKRVYLRISISNLFVPKTIQIVLLCLNFGSLVSFKKILNLSDTQKFDQLMFTMIENFTIIILEFIFLMISAKQDRKKSLFLTSNKKRSHEGNNGCQKPSKDISENSYKSNDSLHDSRNQNNDLIKKLNQDTKKNHDKNRATMKQFDDLENILNVTDNNKDQSQLDHSSITLIDIQRRESEHNHNMKRVIDQFENPDQRQSLNFIVKDDKEQFQQDDERLSAQNSFINKESSIDFDELKDIMKPSQRFIQSDESERENDNSLIKNILQKIDNERDDNNRDIESFRNHQSEGEITHKSISSPANKDHPQSQLSSKRDENIMDDESDLQTQQPNQNSFIYGIKEVNDEKIKITFNENNLMNKGNSLMQIQQTAQKSQSFFGQIFQRQKDLRSELEKDKNNAVGASKGFKSFKGSFKVDRLFNALTKKTIQFDNNINN